MKLRSSLSTWKNSRLVRKHTQFTIGHGISAEYPFLHLDLVERTVSVTLNGTLLTQLTWTHEPAHCDCDWCTHWRNA